MKNQKIVLILLGLALLSWTTDTESWTNGLLTHPDYFPEPVYDFSQNELTQKGIDLGKRIFYDPILSKDSTISCASCHLSYTSFAHTDHDLSHGIGDSIGLRNALPLVNLAWNTSFMWDGGIKHLDRQAIAPITDPREMGETLDNVLIKINSSNEYKTLFKEAFGVAEVDTEHLLKALSQFQLSLISAETKYDSMKQELVTFDDNEKRGYDIFLKECNSCHKEPLFTDFSYKNNGISYDVDLADQGRFRVTHQESDKLKFKVPTLRNIALTPPYMHNGSIKTLKGVVSHYAFGGKHNSNPKSDIRITYLSNQQKNDLLAFLHTLSDQNFVRNAQHRIQ